MGTVTHLSGLDFPLPDQGVRTQIEELSTTVDPDGLAATFQVKYAGIGNLHVEVPYGQIGSIIEELQQAGDTMQARQMGSAQGLIDLCDRAHRPSAIEITVCPTSLDRIFRLHFEDHAPFAFRVDAISLAFCLVKLANAVARAAN